MAEKMRCGKCKKLYDIEQDRCLECFPNEKTEEEEEKYSDDEVIVMYDEDNNKVYFVDVATILYKDKWYEILQFIDEEDDGGYVFELIENEDDDEYMLIDDVEIINGVFEEYYKLL